MNYKKYLKQFGVGVGINLVGISMSEITSIFYKSCYYETPTVKNLIGKSISLGFGTIGMLFILEELELNVDGIFPK